MPQLSAEEFQQIAQLSQDPSIDSATKARAEKAMRDYQDQQHAAAMDPKYPVLPQALAMAPATTHPEGDAQAQKDWISDPQKSALNALYVYEPPLQHVKQELASNPQIVAALQPDTPVQPEELQNLSTDSSLYQAYADLKWREAAAMAAEQGKTAYRYSKAPWLQGGQGMGLLKTLGMKLAGSAVPLSSSANSFVLGVDKATTFGAGRALQEKLGGPEAVAQNTQDTQENPVSNAAGDVLGSIAPWGATNAAFKVATGAAKPLARVIAPAGAGLLARAGARVLGGAVEGAAGSALTQAGQEGVQQAAGTAQPGAGDRIGDAAMLGGAVGGPMAALGGVAGGMQKYIAHGERYQGIPGQLDQQAQNFPGAIGRDGKVFSSVEGPMLSPDTQKVVEQARLAGQNPHGRMALAIAPDIAQGAKAELDGAIQKVKTAKQSYFATPEGQVRQPPEQFMNTALDMLRNNLAPKGEELAPINKETFNEVRNLFAAHVDSVSLTPSKNAIPLDADEARAILTPSQMAEASQHAEASFGAEYHGTVYVTPRRYNPQQMEHVLAGIDAWGGREAARAAITPQAKPPPEIAALDKAARVDRDRFTLGGKPGGWSQLQNENARLLDDAKKVQALAAPNGDPMAAYNVLAGHDSQAPGSILQAEAISGLADKAGVRKQLEQLRAYEPTSKIRSMANFGRTGAGLTGHLYDAALLRLYPGLKSLAGSPAFSGAAGRIAPVLMNSTDEKDMQQ